MAAAVGDSVRAVSTLTAGPTGATGADRRRIAAGATVTAGLTGQAVAGQTDAVTADAADRAVASGAYLALGARATVLNPDSTGPRVTCRAAIGAVTAPAAAAGRIEAAATEAPATGRSLARVATVARDTADTTDAGCRSTTSTAVATDSANTGVATDATGATGHHGVIRRAAV
ncbi:hypothetical protein ABQF47_21210, partial [Mycolicibacter sinensis]